MRRSESTLRILWSGLIALGALAVPATANAQWEAGCHGGATFSNHPTGGSAALPPPGAAFTTVAGLPSRRVPSWFFGDGAALLNQVSTLRASPTITALDPVLNSAAVQRQNGGIVGCQTSRQINRRYTAEFSIDYSRTALTLTDAALAGIEASRASFVSAFSAPQPAGPSGLTPVASATATATIGEPDGYQVFTAALVHVNLRTTGRIIPYATLGGGVVLNRGGVSGATLTGNYRLTSPPGAPNPGTLAHEETDAVTLHYSVERNALVGVVGGGVSYAVRPQWGLRLDVRAHLHRGGIRQRLDARASVPALPAAAVRVLGTNPAIQFSASPAVVSTLSGPPIENFETFRGTGTQIQVHIVPGFFWRF